MPRKSAKKKNANWLPPPVPVPTLESAIQKLNADLPLTLSEFCLISSSSRSFAYRLAGEGRVRFLKLADKTLVCPKSTRAYLSGLPAATIGVPAHATGAR